MDAVGVVVESEKAVLAAMESEPIWWLLTELQRATKLRQGQVRQALQQLEQQGMVRAVPLYNGATSRKYAITGVV